MDMKIVFSVILIALLIAELRHVKLSARSHISEGIFGALLGIVFLTKTEMVAKYLGKWIFEWYLVIAIFLLISSGIHLLRGVAMIIQEDKQEEI